MLDEEVVARASPRPDIEEAGEARSSSRKRSRSASPEKPSVVPEEQTPCLSPIKRARKVDDKDVATATVTATEEAPSTTPTTTQV